MFIWNINYITRRFFTQVIKRVQKSSVRNTVSEPSDVCWALADSVAEGVADKL